MTTSAHPTSSSFLLAQLGAYAATKFADRLAPLGVAPPVAGVLRMVNRDPGRSQREVAQVLGMQPSRLVALVDQLEEDGLLERRPHPTDRRQYALYLTESGTELLDKIGAVAVQHGATLLEPLTQDEQQQLDDLLGKLAAAHGLTPGVHPGYRWLGTRQTTSTQEQS